MEFPEISFLVVESDMANCNFIRKSLQSLGCKVEACKYREQALSLLHKQKQGFNMVLVDVNFPYERVFEFVEIVSKKLNIPIIMMCSTNNNEIISAGMNFGAFQVAVKPIGINDVQRFCQCALEQRTQHLLGAGNSARNYEGLHGQENGSNRRTIGGQLYTTRLVWTENLHALFVEAVHALGGKDLAVPKKIMERMNVPNLTRENIASHLQKYRLYSDPNYVGGKRQMKAAQATQVNAIDEQAPVVALPNRCVLSFEAPEFGPNLMQANEIPAIPDPELESFLAMDLSDPNFPLFDEYPPHDMTIIYGGLSNGVHDNNYPILQSEMGKDDLSTLYDMMTNDPVTDSFVKSNVQASNPVAMHYSQNISAMGIIVDHSNSSGLQQLRFQQEQISGTPWEQQWPWTDLGPSQPSTFEQETNEPSTSV